MPIDNTCEMAQTITSVIDSIYTEGVGFYRCGVGAIELNNRAFMQADIFIPDHTNGDLMKCLDSINHRYGDSTLKIATQGHNEKWQMRREF